MTEPTADRLALLYRITQTFNSSLDLNEVLNCVIDEVIEAMHAGRGFVMLIGEDRSLQFRAARGIDHRTIDDPEFHISRSVVQRVVQESRPLLTSNAQSDAWLSGRTSVMALGLRSILCVPLQHKGVTHGAIYVDNTVQAGIFTERDLELLTAIASHAAAAIDNARLYRIAVEQGRMERELQVAREVQSSLIPNATPAMPGWEFAARWQPARRVAGDFYDFVPIGDGLGVVIADVSDKGMPAALFMALSRSIIRASLAHTHTLAESIAQANRLVCADAANGMFVTLFCAQLDPGSGDVRYVNAGHNQPLACRAGSGECVKLGNSGMALGFFAGAEFAQRTVHLEPGDFVVLYTDGVTEALDAAGQEFGEERLRRLLLDHRAASAEDIASALERAVAAFAGAATPSDDVTFVIAKRLYGC